MYGAACSSSAVGSGAGGPGQSPMPVRRTGDKGISVFAEEAMTRSRALFFVVADRIGLVYTRERCYPVRLLGDMPAAVSRHDEIFPRVF